MLKKGLKLAAYYVVCFAIGVISGTVMIQAANTLADAMGLIEE